MNKKSKKILLSLFVVASLLACATAPQLEEPIDKHRDFNKPFDDIWSYTIEGLTRSGEIITFTEKASGLIRIEKDISGSDIPEATATSRYWTKWQKGKEKVSIYLKPISQTSTRVFVNAQITGTGVPFLQQLPKNFQVQSKGIVEKNYLDLVERLVFSAKEFKSLEDDNDTQEEMNFCLGLTLQELTQDVALALGMPPEKGVFVKQVEQESPACKAGIKAGDVVTSYEGNDCKSVSELSDMIKNTSAGEEVEIKIIRKGEETIVKAVIEEKEEIPNDINNNIP